MDPTDDPTPAPQAMTSIELADAFDDDSLEMNPAGNKFRVGDVTGKPGVLADPQTPAAHVHPAATTSAAGFLAAADKTKLDALAAGQSATLGAVTADAYHETPGAPAYAATLTLDTAVKNDFEVGLLTGNTVITLSNPARGRQGYVAVKQDGTGGRTVTIQATGYTTRRESGTADLVAAPGANAETVYAYLMYQLGGTNCLLLNKLLPI